MPNSTAHNAQGHAKTARESQLTPDSELLTLAEAADLLRAPVATLRYWRHHGTGPRTFRVGRGVRYWRHEVLDWLRQQSDNDGPYAA